MAKIIDGKAIAAQIRGELKTYGEELFAEKGVKPGLAVILVGNRPDSASYVRMKKRAIAEVGFISKDYDFPETATQEEILKTIDEINADPEIHGILVQLPLPSHMDEQTVLKRIIIEKDADGFLADNIGNLALKGCVPRAQPCTPWGCIELLKRSGVQISGKKCVVVGRSNIVGMPVALMLMHQNGTVMVCHSRTTGIAEEVASADIVVAAIGKPEFVKGMWIKEGATVIDVGINSVEDKSKEKGYKIVGDVEFDVAVTRAGAITPVPGGVGPMTIAMLLKNTLNLARISCDLPALE